MVFMKRVAWLLRSSPPLAAPVYNWNTNITLLGSCSLITCLFSFIVVSTPFSVFFFSPSLSHKCYYVQILLHHGYTAKKRILRSIVSPFIYGLTTELFPSPRTGRAAFELVAFLLQQIPPTHP